MTKRPNSSETLPGQSLLETAKFLRLREEQKIKLSKAEIEKANERIASATAQIEKINKYLRDVDSSIMSIEQPEGLNFTRPTRMVHVPLTQAESTNAEEAIAAVLENDGPCASAHIASILGKRFAKQTISTTLSIGVRNGRFENVPQGRTKLYRLSTQA